MTAAFALMLTRASPPAKSPHPFIASGIAAPGAREGIAPYGLRRPRIAPKKDDPVRVQDLTLPPSRRPYVFFANPLIIGIVSRPREPSSRGPPCF